MLEKYLSKLSTNKRKIFSNVTWALLGKIVTSLGVFFVGILVARYLGPEKYGLMNYVISFVTLFTVLADFGFASITIRELSKNPEERNSIMGTCFLTRMAFSTLAYLLVLLWGYNTHADSQTFLMIALYGLYLFTTPFTVIRNYFTSIVQNKYVVKSEISRTCIGAVIKIVFLYFELPLIYFVCAAAFDFFLVAGGYVISYKTKVGSLRDWKFSLVLAKYLCSESWPLALSSSAIIIYQKIDQVMIKNMIDDNSVGYFATAASFLAVVMFLPNILTQTVTPILIRKKKENERIYLEKRQVFTNIMVWGTMIVSAIMSIGAFWIIRLTYGESYIAAVPVLQILAWKTLGAAFSEASGHLIIIDGIQKWAFFRNLFGCIACVIFNLIFIPIWGIVGSAFVAVMTTLITGFLSLAIIPPYREIFKVEVRALFFGWRDILQIKNIVKSK